MIQEISFTTILPLWQTLWPSLAKIKQRAPNHPDGSADPNINSNAVKFWGFYNDTTLEGVISGYKTSADTYRIRGLYVVPTNTDATVSDQLITQAETEAKAESCTMIWMAVLEEHVENYTTAGYVVTGDYNGPVKDETLVLKVMTKSLV